MQPIDSLPPSGGAAFKAPSVAPGASDAKIHKTAKQFEAMFMTEMLRLARPPSHAAGPFAEGQGEKTFQVFMDQALGDAAAAKGGTGLATEIEKAMRAAQGQGNGSGVNK